MVISVSVTPTSSTGCGRARRRRRRRHRRRRGAGRCRRPPLGAGRAARAARRRSPPCRRRARAGAASTAGAVPAGGPAPVPLRRPSCRRRSDLLAGPRHRSATASSATSMRRRSAERRIVRRCHPGRRRHHDTYQTGSRPLTWLLPCWTAGLLAQTENTFSFSTGRGRRPCRSPTRRSRRRCARELRAYFAELMTPEVEAEAHAGRDRRPGLPGGGAPDGPRRLARHRLAEGVRRPGPGRRRAVHLHRRGLAGRGADPVPHDQHRRQDDHGVRHRGAEGRSSCPKILAGELHFSIGYTEPSAGTDLASLRTTAVKDGDEWRINGQKIYTSLASLRRLHLAGRPHRPRRPEAQGHLDLPRAHDRPRASATRRSTRW